MNEKTLIAQLPTLLPLAVDWATMEQTQILQRGVALNADEFEDANTVGVTDPGRVRLLAVPAIPRPDHPMLRAACEAVDFLTAATRGLTLGYGILIREDCWRDRNLIAHELVHTMQYERMGGIAPFLQLYLMECLTVGYDNAPLECEARAASAALKSAL